MEMNAETMHTFKATRPGETQRRRGLPDYTDVYVRIVSLCA